MKHLLRTRALRRRVALTLAATLALPAALPVGTASADHYSNTEELSAEDNVGAAIAYSASTFTETAEEVVLGRDDTFPDSLASGMLQATRPLLLTAGDALSEATKAELERLGATTVHVLGGEQAIQPAVVEALEAEDYTVVRHSGPTRIDTAVEVAKALGASATKAIVARAFGDEEDESRAFADSLAAGGWAAAEAMPVLLTETDKLSDATSAYLADSQITEVFVVGGQAAVSADVVTQLEALGLTVKRVSGPTRFHTALAIAAERGFTTAADAEKVILTEGQAPDAWAAGFAAAARSAKDGAPIVLAVGAEVPEPTLQFLNGGEEPSEDPEAQDPIAGLLCAPMLASEACDTAATALGQIEGAGGELLVVDVTSVGRYDHVVGTLAEPRAVNDFRVTGCGYTNEPVYFEPSTGTFYLMLAGDPGTCAAEFAITLSSGVVKQTVEFTVGEDFTPASALGGPELVVVRPVKQDEEGVHLRFVFDEPIAPAPEINSTLFHIMHYDGGTEPATPAALPSSVIQDPRNPRAVLAVFSSSQYEASTTAVVRGGLVCAKGTGTPCDEPWPGRSKYSLSLGTNDDEVVSGAVRDIDRIPNITGHFGIRTIDRTAGNSDAPDLMSVSDYRADDQSLRFEFSEPVKVPATGTEVGDATVLLKDGTIKKSDANGWSRGDAANTLRATFTGDGLTAADMEQIRRAIVKAGTVQAENTTSGQEVDNTPVAVVIAGGGISDLPDFVGIESPQTTGGTRKATYVFEEDLDLIDSTSGQGSAAKFVAVLANGKIAYPKSLKFATNSKRKVEVTFYDADDTNTTTVVETALDSTVLYYTVLTGAVKSFATQKHNFADTIRVTTPKIYRPGITDAPDLVSVDFDYRKGDCSLAELEGEPGRFELTLQFDEDLVDDATTDNGVPRFEVWYSRGEDDNNPQVALVTSTNATSSSTGAKPTFGAKDKELSFVITNTQSAGQQSCDAEPTKTEWKRAKYLAVEWDRVTEKTGGTLKNYAAGMPIPN